MALLLMKQYIHGLEDIGYIIRDIIFRPFFAFTKVGRTTISYYSTPIRMATIKKQQKISVDRNVKKKKMEPLCTLGRSVVKWCSHYGK